MRAWKSTTMFFVLLGLLSGRQFATAQDIHVETRLLFLRHSIAEEMPHIINSLFPDADVRIAVDERTNSLIAKGPQNLIDEIEGIISKLDTPAAQPEAIEPQGFDAAAGGASSKDGSLITSPVDGTSLVAFVIEDGSHVKKGEVLVKLSDADLVTDLERIRVQLEHFAAASSSHDDIDGAVEQTENKLYVRLARLRMEHGVAELAFRAESFTRDIKAAGENIGDTEQFIEMLARRKNASQDISDKELLEGTLMLREQQQRLVLLERTFELFQQQARPLKLAELEAELILAQTQLKETQLRLEQSKRQRQAEAEAEAAQRDVLKKQHQRLKKQHEARKLRAPFAGIVHHLPAPKQAIIVGSTVRGGQPLLSISKQTQ